MYLPTSNVKNVSLTHRWSGGGRRRWRLVVVREVGGGDPAVIGAGGSPGRTGQRRGRCVGDSAILEVSGVVAAAAAVVHPHLAAFCVSSISFEHSLGHEEYVV